MRSSPSVLNLQLLCEDKITFKRGLRAGWVQHELARPPRAKHTPPRPPKLQDTVPRMEGAVDATRMHTLPHRSPALVQQVRLKRAPLGLLVRRTHGS